MLTTIFNNDSNEKIIEVQDANTLLDDDLIKINRVAYQVVSSQKFSSSDNVKQVLRVEEINDDNNDFDYDYIFKSKTNKKTNSESTGRLSLV